MDILNFKHINFKASKAFSWILVIFVFEKLSLRKLDLNKEIKFDSFRLSESINFVKSDRWSNQTTNSWLGKRGRGRPKRPSWGYQTVNSEIWRKQLWIVMRSYEYKAITVLIDWNYIYTHTHTSINTMKINSILQNNFMKHFMSFKMKVIRWKVITL